MKKIKLKKQTAKTPQQIQLQKQRRKKIIKISLIVVAIVITSASVYLGYGIFKQVDGFSKEKLLSNESTVLCDVNGNEYFSFGSDGTKKNVAYEDIPQVMIDAVVAAEDSRFFEHNGFDLPRIVKALIGNIAAGGITGGGSTITQQVIKKSYYPKEEQTIERKVGEIILAIEATSQTTKEEILELYLNKIYFGYGNKAIGIYAASRYYFDKDVQDLTLPEAALLAGTLNSPNSYDPFRNLELAQKRRNTILKLMLQHGYITEEEYETTKAIPVENTLKSNPLSSGGKYQAYADKVYREVEEKTGYNPHDTAMRIYTYIDTDLQDKLDAIASGESYKFLNDDIQVGASVQEATTGRIVGVISGRDYEPLGLTYAYAASKDAKSQYGQRNSPGSSLKPIIAYASAFEFLNYSTAHYVHDVPLTGTYNPQNWNGKYHGDLTISEALRSSWNLAAIQTYLEVKNGNGTDDGVGVDKIVEYMEGFGFDMYGEKNKANEAGFAIGSWNEGISPEEEAGAYAAIANGGTYIEPHTVSKIEILSTGEVIDLEAQYQKEKHQAISEESAFMIREIMTGYLANGGEGNYSYLNLGYQIGAKTGTSTYDASAGSKLNGRAKDGWMAAFSPDYSWSVWVGYNSTLPKRELTSTRDAGRISGLIAKYVHSDGVKNSYPSQPSGITNTSCISGIYPYVSAGEGVPSDRIAKGWFKNSNLPSGSASGATLNSLQSFTASVTDGKISVNFTEYDPKSMTESSKPTKTYKTHDGKSYTLPYLGDISQIYGKVVYVAEVTDASGQVVHSEKLSTNTATLNYTPTGGTYTITGYYAFENSSATSNKLTQSVKIDDTTQTATYSQVSLTANQFILQVNLPTGSELAVSINGTSQTVTTSGQVKFDNLTPSTSYTITLTETRSDGKTTVLAPITFTTPSE